MDNPQPFTEAELTKREAEYEPAPPHNDFRRAYATIRQAQAEVAELREKLQLDMIGTHSEGCWDFGRKHYGCALGEIDRLQKQARDAEQHALLLEEVMEMQSNIVICAQSLMDQGYKPYKGSTMRVWTYRGSMHSLELAIQEYEGLQQRDAEITNKETQPDFERGLAEFVSSPELEKERAASQYGDHYCGCSCEMCVQVDRLGG